MTASDKDWTGNIKRKNLVLGFARQHPNTPLLIKICVVTIAYLLNAMNLPPDFISPLVYVEDVFLLHSFIWSVIESLPTHVMQECRHHAKTCITGKKGKPHSIVVAFASAQIGSGALP